MDKVIPFIGYSVAIGVGATAFLDIWGVVRSRFSDAPHPDYTLVGRWLSYMREGVFRHASIRQAIPRNSEVLIGWAAHYVIGIIFAGLLLAVWGLNWAQHPTLAPALIMGFASVLSPFFLMQPGMGAGIAASLTPDPATARSRSVITHGMFGLGLYVAGWITNVLVHWGLGESTW